METIHVIQPGLAKNVRFFQLSVEKGGQSVNIMIDISETLLTGIFSGIFEGIKRNDDVGINVKTLSKMTKI